VIDTVRTFETPEGVGLGVRAAGPLVRSLAWAVDVLIRSTAWFAIAIAVSPLGEAGMGLFLLVAFLLEWFYPVAFEVLMHGQTPGKRAMGIAVVHDNGTPVAFSSSVVRNLLRFADFLPLGYGFGLASMLVSPSFQRLGDLAAGTLVVYREPTHRAPPPPEIDPIAPPVPLDVDEQRALVEFATRRAGWTDERAAELSSVLEPLTRLEGAAGTERLMAHAAWLLGRR